MVDDRTNTYTVTMDPETGMWSAEYDLDMVTRLTSAQATRRRI